MIEYPEHEKLKSLADKREIVQEFLDWLFDEHKVPARDKEGETVQTTLGLVFDTHTLEEIQFGRREGEEYWRSWTQNYGSGEGVRRDLIGAFLGIDQAVLENEKRAMLEEMRASND